MNRAHPRRARVCAAFRAAADRPLRPFVRTARRAEAERCDRVRFCAALCACLDRDLRVAALWPSRLSTRAVALERRLDFGSRLRPAAYARCALRRVFSEVWPFFGGASTTPARRAFERPMAIACLLDLAPCLPSRM